MVSSVAPYASKEETAEGMTDGLKAHLARRENLLLLLSARTDLDAGQVELFQECCREKLDWDELLLDLRRHYLHPLFLQHHHAVAKSNANVLNSQFKAETVISLQRQLTLAVELNHIMGVLQHAGVKVLSYKGPALAHLSYGKPALRPFQDLDILVDRAQLRACLGILIDEGYQPQDPHHGPGRLDILLRQADGDYEVAMDPTRSLGAIDLHWRVMPPHFPFALSFEELWERRIPSDVGPNVVTFGLEDTVLVHCAHCIKHGWRRIEWIAGTLALLKSEALDWDALWERAGNLGMRRLLLLGVRLALDLDLVGRPESDSTLQLPAAIRHALETDRAVPRLATPIWNNIFARHDPIGDRLSSLTLYLMRARERPVDRWCQVTGTLATYLRVGPEDIYPTDHSLLVPYLRRCSRLLAVRRPKPLDFETKTRSLN